VLHDEVAVAEVAHDGENLPEELEDWILLRVGFHVVADEDLSARVDEERPEHVEQPLNRDMRAAPIRMKAARMIIAPKIPQRRTGR